MVNPLARKSMSKYLNNGDKREYQEYSSVTNLGTNENKIIKKIINGDRKVTTMSSKTLSLDEAVQRIKDKR